MADEQLYGREATEQAQGYQPMPEPVADKPDPELEQAQAIERIIDRDPPSPIVERKYVRADDEGKPQPDNRTVELDRAAEDLAQNRETEAAIAEIERGLQLANEIDAARREGLGQSVRAQQPEAQQPEGLQQQTQPQQQSAPADGVDPALRAALQNPAVLSVLERHHLENTARVEAAERDAAAKADQAISSAAQWAQTNAELAAAAILVRPELQGVHPSQLGGAIQALATANPQAAQQIQQQLSNARTLVQQAAEARNVASQRAAIQFQQAAAQHDAAFDQTLANETPETRMAIKQGAVQLLVDSGMTPEQIQWNWNNNGLLRSFAAQSILADAARFRINKAAIANKVSRPVPQVNRPGSSMDRPEAAGRADFALEAKYSGNLNPKQAAELLISRRARSR